MKRCRLLLHEFALLRFFRLSHRLPLVESMILNVRRKQRLCLSPTLVGIIAVSALATTSVALADCTIGPATTKSTTGTAQPTAVARAAQPLCADRYTVRAGDTLSALSARCNVSVIALENANPNNTPLQIGRSLVIPGGYVIPTPVPPTATPTATPTPIPGVHYTIQPGDTLSALALRYGVTVAQIVAHNNPINPRNLRIGQVVIIPLASVFSQMAQQTPSISPTSISPNRQPTPSVRVAALSNVTPNRPATSQHYVTINRDGVRQLLLNASTHWNVDPALVQAVAWQESGWTMVDAHDGGMGIMQIMPKTAHWITQFILGYTFDPHKPADNVNAGVALLSTYDKLFPHNPARILIAYHAGLNAPASPSQQTAELRRYVRNVLALRDRFASGLLP